MDCGSPQGVYLNTRSHANLVAQQYQHLTAPVIGQYPNRGSEGSGNSKYPQQRLSTSAMDSSMDTSRSYSHQQHQHRTSKSSNAITVPSSFDESLLIQPTLYGLEASSVALSPLSPPNMQFDPAANHHKTMPGGIIYSRSYSSPQGETLHSSHGGRSVPQFFGTNATLFTHENGLPPSKQFTFQLGDRNSNPYHHHHQGGTGTGNNNSNSDSCTHSPMMQGVVVQN